MQVDSRGSHGCYCIVPLGDVDFFLLDTRTFRSPPGAPEKTLLGPAQLAWLQKNLAQSKASFKILAAPIPLFTAPGAADSWTNYPEQKSFLDWLAANKINGIIALAGSQPAGQLNKLDPPKAGGPALPYPLYTLSSSSLSQPPGPPPPAISPADPTRVGAPFADNNFGTLDFGGRGDHRFVTLRLRDAKGAPRVEQTIFAVQLRN